MLEQPTFNFPRINISNDKNDKDSIYFVDLVGYMLGIDESKEHLLEFCKRQENATKKMKDLEAKLLEMLKLINKYFTS